MTYLDLCLQACCASSLLFVHACNVGFLLLCLILELLLKYCYAGAVLCGLRFHCSSQLLKAQLFTLEPKHL